MKKYRYSCVGGDEWLSTSEGVSYPNDGDEFYLASDVDARITQLNLQLIEQGGELGKCQENRNKNMETIRRYEARIADLEKALQAISIVEFNGSCCGCSGDWSLDECHRLAKEALGL